jgi:hypothetical protein
MWRRVVKVRGICGFETAVMRGGDGVLAGDSRWPPRFFVGPVVADLAINVRFAMGTFLGSERARMRVTTDLRAIP